MATKGSLGVFIDSKMVYAAFVSGAQQTTCAVSIAGVPEDLDFDAKITDAVRNAAQQLAPAQKSAYLAMPGESSMVRSFELPFLPKKEEAAAVRFEAQKYVPFELRDLCYDYESLSDSTRKKISVLFYASRKNAVERQVACVENAGVAVQAVEVLSISLARSFNQEIVKNNNAIYMLIRVSENRDVELIVAKNQTVLLSRHVTLEQMPGLPQWESTPFLAELRLSLDYYDDIFKGQAISKIYVSAPTREGMQALTETIHQAFSMTVEAVSSGGVSSESAAGLAVAHGLALRDAPGSRGKKINLKPSAVAQAVEAGSGKNTLKDFATKLLMAAVAVFVAAYLFFGQSVKRSNAELQRLSAAFEASPGTPVSMSKSGLEGRRLFLEQRLLFFGEIVDRRRFFTDKLNTLAKTVPPEIRLSTFQYEDDVSNKGQSQVLLRIEGYTPTEEQSAGVVIIGKFASKLQADKEFMKGFAQVRINSTKSTSGPRGEPVLRFDLECASAKRAAP